MRIPDNNRDLIDFAIQTAKDCMQSQSQRVSAYQQYGQVAETGRKEGGLGLANLIYSHIDRLAAHLFSPSELRFTIDYENIYPKDWLAKGAVAARIVSRAWEQKNIDMLFGHGVKQSLTYGSCILKQLGGRDGEGIFQFKGAKLVMPWQFGVYNEGINDLSEQEAFCETDWLNRHEVWRRVRSLPAAEKLYRTIIGNANKEEGTGSPTSFMHQVLSTAILNTSTENVPPRPGGIVQLATGPNYSTLTANVAIDLYPMQNLWVWDDERDDYTTIQFIEPNVLIAPLLKHTNLFVPDVHPYTFIQPNYEPGYIWGRSEIVDLLMLQAWLTEHLDDMKRLMGLQIDKLMAFPGYEGITDELYEQFRTSGFAGLPQGVTVQDLTPKFPAEALPMIPQIIALMDRVSGFPPIMSGQGETGVRSGIQTDTLMKTGSPRLRDRSLLVERQCAAAADTTLWLFQAKEAKAYWTDPEKGETDFLLSQIPEDRRIAVDSHSGSPIYHDDNMQLLAFGLKAGIITGESFIEQSSLAHKDVLVERLREKEASQLKLMLEHPELLPGGKGRQAAISTAAQAPKANGAIQ